MLDILKFTFESYSHYWGMILLIYLLTGGIRAMIKSVARALAEATIENYKGERWIQSLKDKL